MSAPTSSAPSLRIPPWLRVKLPCNHTFADTRALVEGLKLNTVCQSAKCPNMFECFSSGTATFLILGGVCTRNCAFCNITPGQVLPPDPDEPARVAQAAHTLGLSHVVVTSVTRDDLSDGGAAHFAATIRALRATPPAQPQDVAAAHQQEARVHSEGFAARQQHIATPQEPFAAKQHPLDAQHQNDAVQSTCSCGGTCGGDHDHATPKPHDCLCNGGPADPTLPPSGGCACASKAHPAGLSPLVAGAHLRPVTISGQEHPAATPSPQQATTPSTTTSTPKVITIEVLIPDFQGNADALQCVIEASPDIINHNVETPPAHYARIRPQADYQQSLDLLRRVRAAGAIAKSGLMVGLGETDEEVRGVLHDLASAGCHIVTIGQYMRPSRHHPPVERYVHPDVFEQYAAWGHEAGIPHVFSAPLVRSSYNAQSAYAALEAMRSAKT